MPTLNKEFLCLLQDDYTKYNIFIETGTYNGSTIFSMESLFASLYTIEISEKHYRNTKQRYTDMKRTLSLPMNNKIKFLLGDSSIVIQYILPTITEKCIIFLDGHWSGDDTGRGEIDCPLIEEITHINELCKTEAIIIIDDYRLFGKGPKNGYNEDWSDINTTKLVGILQGRISKTYSLDTESNKDDRLIIHINAIKSVEDIEHEQRMLKEEEQEKQRILKEEEKQQREKEQDERITRAVEIAVSEANSVLKLQIDTYAEELQILKLKLQKM